MNAKRAAAGLALIALCAVFQFFTIRDGHPWMDDAFMYIMHADNLVSGRPYADTCYVYNPENPYVGPRAYPPGYPAVLTVPLKLGGGLKAMKAGNVFFLSGLLACLLFFFTSPAGDFRLLGLLALFGLNPVLWDYKDLVYSDILFCCLLYLSLLLHRLSYSRPGLAMHALAGFCAYLAYAVRPLGALLPAALVLEDLLAGKADRRRQAVLCACFLAPAAAQAFFFDLSSYADQLASPIRSALLPSAVKVLKEFLFSLKGFWALGPETSLPAALAALALAFLTLFGFAAGLVRRVRESKLEAMDFFAAFYLLTVAGFGMYDGVRYIFPLMPYLVWKAFEGFEIFGGAVMGRRAAAAFLAAAFALYGWSFAIKAEYGPMNGGPYGRPAQEMFGFLKGASSAADTIIFVKPRSMCFFTGRKSSIYPPYGNDAHFTAYFREAGASYLVVSRVFGQDALYLYGFAERNRASLEKVYDNPDFKVFRLRK
ncbi:MAG: hypothetical protein NTX59_11285 [Elusimicrobia bacterium]|nr:hypothetical protein [Elusimicrobiota bacterium]